MMLRRVFCFLVLLLSITCVCVANEETKEEAPGLAAHPNPLPSSGDLPSGSPATCPSDADGGSNAGCPPESPNESCSPNSSASAGALPQCTESTAKGPATAETQIPVDGRVGETGKQGRGDAVANPSHRIAEPGNDNGEAGSNGSPGNK
ncbi:uncharacterized protein TM35_000531100, partial [Trypanosoma theileri]